MSFLKSEKSAKLVVRLLAIYGVLSILFSAFWMWIVYRPPCIGYSYIYDRGILGEYATIIEGKAHIMKKEFHGNAMWATILTTVGGLILITCACIRNKYTAHGYFIYVLTAFVNCVIVFTLTVFFLMLALGSQGHLDWYTKSPLDELNKAKPERQYYGYGPRPNDDYPDYGQFYKLRQIQCGIVNDFQAMYGMTMSDDDWDAKCSKEVGKFLELDAKKQEEYHFGCGQRQTYLQYLINPSDNENRDNHDSSDGTYGSTPTYGRTPTYVKPKITSDQLCAKNHPAFDMVKNLFEVKAQEKRVLGISIFMVNFGFLSLLFTILTIPAALLVWKHDTKITVEPSEHQPSSRQPSSNQPAEQIVHRQPSSPEPPQQQRSMTGQPIESAGSDYE